MRQHPGRGRPAGADARDDRGGVRGRAPAGFRHFIAAYLRFALRHLGTGAAAVDSAIWSLSPDRYDDAELRAFARSKLEPLDEDQRAAAVAFLEAVRDLGDEDVVAEAELALAWWRQQQRARGFSSRMRIRRRS